jgi:hypothetical protein
MLECVKEELETFTGRAPLGDDRTLIAVRCDEGARVRPGG